MTHAQRCAPGKERDQVPHGRGARGVDSLIFDVLGKRLANELSRRDCVTGSTAKQMQLLNSSYDEPVVVRRQAPTAQETGADISVNPGDS